ncbi:hypothetical protein HK097_003675, partial [Rhizophlyctis rosea]
MPNLRSFQMFLNHRRGILTNNHILPQSLPIYIPHRGWHSLIRWTPPKFRPQGPGYEFLEPSDFESDSDSDDEFSLSPSSPSPPYQRPPSQILRTAVTSPNATPDTAWQAFVWARTNPGVLRALSWKEDVSPLLKILSKSRNRSETVSKMNEVLSSLHIATHRLSAHYYHPLLLTLGPETTYDTTIQIIKEMLKREARPTTHTFRIILKNLLACKPPDFESFSKIGTLMDEMEIEPDAMTYTQIVRRFVLENKVHVAEAVLDMLVEKGAPLRATVWNVVLGCYARKENLRKTFEVFEKMQRSGMQADGFTFGILTVVAMQRGDKEG